MNGRRFAVLAVVYAGLGDFLPLYAVYALLFAAEGISPAGISSLFVIWSITAFVVEVPSGAWADVVSRRLLLAGGSLLTAAGFALWLLVPTYAGFAGGFVLWGIGGALASGTWESLVYDALTERRAAQRYAGVIGGGESAGWIAAVASAALTTPLLAAGGYALVGWCSVGIALLHAALAAALPAPTRTGVDPEELDDLADPGAPAGADGEAPGAASVDAPAAAPAEVRSVVAEYLATLAAGLREATRHPPVRRAVVRVSLLMGLLAFDEYLPLVAAGAGFAEGTVPLLMALTFGAQALASALAGRAARLPAPRRAGLLALGAVLIAAGAASRSPAGFAALVAGYALANCMMIVAGADLQHAITGRARATVTSTVGLGSEIVAVAVFLAYAGGSLLAPVGVLVAVNALPLLAVAARSRHGHSRVRVQPPWVRS